MEPRDAIGKGLDIYRDEMRSFIRQTLQAAYGETWFSEQVAPLLGGERKRKQRLKEVLGRGKSAERQFDVGEFQIVIKTFSDHFPEPIRHGQHHHGRLNEIAADRNKHAHDLDETLYPADAEAVLGRCREVLSLCGRMSAVQAIENIANQLSAASQGQEASVPTLIEDAATPPITDVPEYPVDEPLPPSSSETSATDVVVEFWGFMKTMLAVVGGLVALAAVAVIIFFAVDRWASGDDSSTSTSQSQVTETTEPEQEGISIPSENGRGGGVQEQTAPVRGPEPIENDGPLSCADNTVDLRDDQDDAVSPKTGIGYAKLWDVAQGRIVMRVQDGDDDDDYRIEFGFLPEWTMDDERSWQEAIEDWVAYLPAQRHLTESMIERRASDDMDGWLCSSPISVPAKLPDSLDDTTPEIIGRVTLRLSHDAVGRLRIEFGFEAQVTSVDITDRHRKVTRLVLRPSSGGYVTEMTIAGGRGVWLRSSAISVFTGPDPLGGFARCGSGEPAVFYIDQVNWTKHRVEITDDQATLIFGPSWQETLHTLLPSGCVGWQEGDIYDFAEVRRIHGS